MRKQNKYEIPFEDVMMNYPDKSPSSYDINLFKAVKNGDNRVVEFFLKKGADPNKMHKWGTGKLHKAIYITSLMVAAIKGYTSISKTLIENGAKINKKTQKGQTALHFSVEYDQYVTTRFLLNNNANPNIFAGINNVPLFFWYSDRYVADPESLDIMLRKTKDLSYVNDKGKNFLDVLWSDAMLDYLASSYSLQKILITKNISYLKSLNDMKLIHPKIEKKYQHLINAIELNIL